MKRIEEIDRNFHIETNLPCDDLCFYDAETMPFRIYGITREGDRFCRMPESVAKAVNEGVHQLYANTAGGRVRFVTDSCRIAISAKMDKICKMSHFPLTGSGGFDLYTDEEAGQCYCGTFMPPYEMEDGYESMISIPRERRERIITIHFPLYSDVKKLWIGLEQNAVVKPAPDYIHEKPIVFYGSSITQGGCASRPGNAYQAILSRRLDCNFINLGFSGSARGESVMADYIASLDMRAFVMDYDHNAPTVEHLEQTHEAMFRRIRKAHPELPVIFMTRPKVRLLEDEKARQEVVRRTYENARAAGDEYVRFLCGRDLITPQAQETATVDNCHPNDSGFASMAYALEKVLRAI